MSRHSLLLLFALMCFSYVLRVTGTETSVIFSNDPQLIRQSMQVGQTLLNSNGFSTGFETGFKYPLTLTYFLTSFYGAFFLVGRALGVFESAIAFQDYLFSNRATIYTLAVFGLNLISVFLVPTIFFAQRALNQRHKGWLAAGLAATNLLLVQFAHQPRPHVPFATIAFIAVVLLTLASLRVGGRKSLYAASIASAFTAGALQSGLLIALPFLLSVVLRPYYAGRYHKNELLSLHTCLSGFLFIGVSLALNPGLVDEIAGITASVFGGASLVRFGNDAHAFSFSMLSLANLPQFISRLQSYHPILTPLFPIALAYFVWIFRRQTKLLLVGLSFPLLNFILWGLFQGTYPRITAVLAPFMIFLAAYFIEDVIFSLQRRVGANYHSLILALILVLPTVNGLRLVQVLLRNDTRSLATEWVNSNLSQGASIMLNFQLMTLLPLQSAISRQTADYPASVGTYWHWLDGQSGELLAPTYDIYNKLYWDQLADSAAQSRFIASAGIRYLLLQSSVANPTVDAMIAYAQEHGRLLKVFCPAYATPVAELPDDMFADAWRQIWLLERPGPFIALYDLHQPPSPSIVAEYCQRSQ